MNILGVAASAASLIAMAGDEISISPAAGIMIHNSQALIGGDRHDMEDASENLSRIDAAIRKVYAQRTGLSDEALDKMMTPLSGTWLFGKDAVKKGFADKMLAENAVVADPKAASETKVKSDRALIDTALASMGFTRKERRGIVRGAFSDRVFLPTDEVDTSAQFSEIAELIRHIGKPEKV